MQAITYQRHITKITVASDGFYYIEERKKKKLKVEM
jgi:hypothetical protein